MIQLQPGDRVFDKDSIGDPDELPSLAIVLRSHSKPCGSIEITDDGETIPLHEFGVNPEYADENTPAVTIAFTDWLDGNVPRWDEVADDIDALRERIEMMKTDYSIPVDRYLYDYPTDRLSFRFRP